VHKQNTGYLQKGIVKKEDYCPGEKKKADSLDFKFRSKKWKASIKTCHSLPVLQTLLSPPKHKKEALRYVC